jgi:hypothetical protein
MDKNIHTLSFYPKFNDKITPSISSLIAISKSDTSIINGSMTYTNVVLNNIAKNRYFADTIKYQGVFGLAVNCYDKTYQTANKTGVYSLQLFIDDHLFYESKVDETFYSKNHYINLDRYFHLVKYQKKYYQKLFKEAENKLKIYSHKNFGIVDRNLLNKDTVNYKIVVSDYNGNTSLINGVIVNKVTEVSKESFSNLKEYDDMYIVFNKRIYELKTGLEKKVIEENNKFHFNTDKRKIDLSYWDKNQNNSYEYNEFHFSLKKRRLFKSSYVFVDTISKINFPKLNYQSEIIYFAPQGLLIDGRLNLHVNRKIEKNESVYTWNFRKKKWDFRRLSAKDTNKPYLKEQSIDLYTIIRDTVEPRIEKIWKKSDFVLIKVWDDLSGIRDEKNWEIFSGNKKIVAEYDYEEMILKIEKKDLVSEKIKFILRDNASNEINRIINIE